MYDRHRNIIIKTEHICKKLSTISKIGQPRIDCNLNHAKTKHICFGKKNYNSVDNGYFLGINRIEKVSSFKDLRIIFDEKLTFITHVDELVSKMKSLYGAAYRFARDINNLKAIKKIVYSRDSLHTSRQCSNMARSFGTRTEKAATNVWN